MMLNTKRSSQSAYFATLVNEGQNLSSTKKNNIVNNDNEEHFNLELEACSLKRESPKGVYLIKDKRFTSSNISTQDTLMSNNTQLTYETLSSVTSCISETAEQSKKSLVSHGKRCFKSNSTVLSGTQSIHSNYTTTVRKMPKSDVVLINNMPYPTKLVFPSKIATDRYSNSSHGAVNGETKYFSLYDSDDSYENILQVIEAYAY